MSKNIRKTFSSPDVWAYEVPESEKAKNSKPSATRQQVLTLSGKFKEGSECGLLETMS